MANGSSWIDDLRWIAVETAVVIMAGLGLSLFANQISPHGLVLQRDYFALLPAPIAAGPGRADSSGPESGVGDLGSAPASEGGLMEVGFDDVLAAHQDPRREAELILFIDARNERAYQEGHLPGAWPFDRFYPERHLPEVVPACLGAEMIIVYCNGGDCEDSKFAARLLVEAGVPAERLRLYAGGIVEWTAQGQLLEAGARHSGDLRPGTP
ncbi:MAG: rhodanese-like domain-containing protein [Limisphaerales bacterium]